MRGFASAACDRLQHTIIVNREVARLSSAPLDALVHALLMAHGRGAERSNATPPLHTRSTSRVAVMSTVGSPRTSNKSAR
jgi:hypothetical protein